MRDEQHAFVQAALSNPRFIPGWEPTHMPRADFMRLLSFKGFKRCHICGRSGYLVVDHNHSTGLVRGLLCDSCNKLLGAYERFMRDAEFRQRCAAYVKNPPAAQLNIQCQYDEKEVSA